MHACENPPKDKLLVVARCFNTQPKLLIYSTETMEQQHCLTSSATAMAKKKSSFPWWDPFSHCRGEEELDSVSESDDPCNDMNTLTAANDCSDNGCVETAIDTVMSILRDLLSSSNGSSSGEEEDQAQADEQDEVVTTHHHMEPTSTCNGSCLDDKITDSSSDPLDDNISLVDVEPQSEHGIPDIDNEVEALNTNETVSTSLNDVTRSVKKDADTALSWFVLTGILGSPAPSSVVKHGRKSDVAVFWDLEEGIIKGDNDDIPDIQEDSIDTSKDGEETCTTAFLSSESDSDYESEADLCIVPDIDDMEQPVSHEFCNPQEAMAPQSIKKVADSALAWGALAMILNAPAPSAVATNCTTKNLFEDNELTVELDDVVLSL